MTIFPFHFSRLLFVSTKIFTSCFFLHRQVIFPPPYKDGFHPLLFERKKNIHNSLSNTERELKLIYKKKNGEILMNSTKIIYFKCDEYLKLFIYYLFITSWHQEHSDVFNKISLCSLLFTWTLFALHSRICVQNSKLSLTYTTLSPQGFYEAGSPVRENSHPFCRYCAIPPLKTAIVFLQFMSNDFNFSNLNKNSFFYLLIVW